MNIENLKSRNNLSLNEIDLLISHEKDVNMMPKLYFFRFNALGISTVKSYELANIPRSTAYHLVDLWNEGGYNALLPKERKGRDPKLNKTQLKELGEILNKKDKWSIKEVEEIIKDKWNVEYSYHGVRNLLLNVFEVEIENLLEKRSKEAKMVKKQTGDFEDLSKDENKEIQMIVNAIAEEKQVDVLKRLVLVLLKKIGVSTSNSSYFLGVTDATGNNWLRKWKEDQYYGLLHKPGQGRKSGLTPEHIEIIKKTPKTR